MRSEDRVVLPRALMSLLFGAVMVLGLLAIQVHASAESSPKRVTISDLIDSPDNYYDQRLVVSGVLLNDYWGPKLCASHAGRCVDLDGPHLPFEHNDETYTGAVIEVVGYFGDTCKLHDPPPEDSNHVEKIVCMDRGGNGWISADSVKIIGADLECRGVNCGTPKPPIAREVDLSSPDASGVDEFAKRVVTAIRRHDERELLALTPAPLRTSTAWYLKVRGGPSSKIFFPPEIANAADAVTRPGSGYRLFDVAAGQSTPAHQRICFCTSGNCGDAWSHALEERIGFKRHLFRCLYVWRGPAGWSWLY